MKALDFWFDPVSPYAWLAFQRLPEALRRAVVHGELPADRVRRAAQALRPQGPGRDRAEARLDLPPGRTGSATATASPLDTPARHPFNPIALSRLAWATAPEARRRAATRARRSCATSGMAAAPMPRIRRGSRRCASELAPAPRSGERRRSSSCCATPPTPRSRAASSACRPSASTASCSGASTPSTWRRISSAATPGSTRRTGSSKARRGRREALSRAAAAQQISTTAHRRYGFHPSGSVSLFQLHVRKRRFRPPRCASSSPHGDSCDPGRKPQHGHIISSGRFGGSEADDARGAQGHLRLESRHRLRVVRLLSVRLARRHHRQAVLRRPRSDRGVHRLAAWLSRPASWCVRSARSSSAASATSSAASTPSW